MFFKHLIRIIERLTPVQILVNSFAGLIAFGTACLEFLPGTTKVHVNFIDHLFIVTSAVCVTGLAPIDVGQSYTTFGQSILILCMQGGGIGLMTFASVAFYLFGQKASFRSRATIQESIAGERGSIGSLVKRVVVYSAIIELIGTLILWYGFPPRESVGLSFFNALFHAVSAFCNAGLGLYSDNLISFHEKPIIVLTICALLVIGGLGFVVLEELSHRVKNWRVQTVKKPFSLHTRVVLMTTFILFLIGFVGFLVLTPTEVLGPDASAGEWVLNAVFQSFTPRTAGFSTVDYTKLSTAFLVITIFLMFVGASPGSTGGGIKTTTAATMYSLFFSRLRGQEHVSIFKRTLSDSTIWKAVATFTAYACVLAFFSFLLILTELGKAAYASGKPVDYLGLLFEVTSALGTVGLSMNVSPTLSYLGKWIIIMVMFLGRVGPLSIVVAIGSQKAKSSFMYAEEKILIG